MVFFEYNESERYENSKSFKEEYTKLSHNKERIMKVLPKTMNTADAAWLLGVKPSTLNCWRSQRKGPPYIKVGGRILYDEADLDAWLKQRTIHPEGRIV